MRLYQVGAIQPVHVLQLGLRCNHHDSRAIRFYWYGEEVLLGIHRRPMEETTANPPDSSRSHDRDQEPASQKTMSYRLTSLS